MGICPTACDDHVISTPAAYAEAFAEAPSPPAVHGLVGRVLRGRPESDDFLRLSPETSRKVVFVMGPDGLARIAGKSGWQILIEIGYEASYIRKKLEAGLVFKLFVVADTDRVPSVRQATWDGALDVACAVYPGLADKINAQRAALIHTPFEDIQAEAGYEYGAVHLAGESHSLFMTEARLAAMPVAECGLVQVRGFLYNTMHMRELYSGDGRTRTEDGEPGMEEWLMPNVNLSELGEDCALLPMEVVPPREDLLEVVNR